MKLNEMTLTDLQATLAAGRASAKEIAQDCLAAVARKDGEINAFERVDEAAVLAAADAADAAAGEGRSLGLLHGLPIAFKANIDVAGYATTGSNRALKDHKPSEDSAVSAAMKGQGAVPFGKLNMHELAFGATSNNPFCGAVHNPFGLSHVPGGSSGGTGAAVGGDLVPAAIGTDTGGSVRVPAALCGAAGFRPSTGRWSAKGILPISHTRDTAGPVAHAVADLDLVDRAVTDPGRAAAEPASLKGRRFGVPRGFFFDTLAPDVAAATERALADLQAEGVELVEVDLGALWEEIDRDGMLIAIWEFKSDLQAYLEGSGIAYDTVLDGISSPDVAGLAEVIRGLPPETQGAYDEILSVKRVGWQKQVAELFETRGLEAMVYPMVCATAPEIGKDETFEIEGVEVPVFGTLVRNSAVGSVLGLPGLALPNGRGLNGLPISLGLDGPSGQDAALLSLGLAVEQVLPGNTV